MTSEHKTTAAERTLRIEMARARAELERRAVAHDVHNVVQALQPRAIVQSLLPARFRSRGRAVRSLGTPADWILRAMSLTRRYPLLTSGASALLTTVARRRGRHKLLWRIGAGLLVAWQFARKAGDGRDWTSGRDQDPDWNGRDIDMPRGRIR